MMGHREKMKGGDEWDDLTKRGRYYTRRAGTSIRWVKRKFNKRIRRNAKDDTQARFGEAGAD